MGYADPDRGARREHPPEGRQEYLRSFAPPKTVRRSRERTVSSPPRLPRVSSDHAIQPGHHRRCLRHRGGGAIPGAPEKLREVAAAGVPIFGICLGHQLLALACGAKTVKMKFGHHGANHPVQDLENGRVMITSQNHGFAVDDASLPENLLATHRSLFDGSLQGVSRTDCAAFSFQGHPEASPGPHDVAPLFDRFVDAIRSAQG